MIYDDEFMKIWDGIIYPSIMKFSKRFGVKYKPLYLVRSILEYRYNKYKDIVVKTYMHLDTTNIDRHKIAACILKAILATKPLFIPLKAKWKILCTKKSFVEILQGDMNRNIHQLSERDKKKLGMDFNKQIFFLNEYFAISVVVSILDSYINSDNRDNRFKHKIVLPEPFPKADNDYLLDVCIGMHYSKPRNCNPILFANTLFLWEKYSCRKSQCDNLIKSYMNLFESQGKPVEDAIDIIQKIRFGII